MLWTLCVKQNGLYSNVSQCVTDIMTGGKVSLSMTPVIRHGHYNSNQGVKKINESQDIRGNNVNQVFMDISVRSGSLTFMWVKVRWTSLCPLMRVKIGSSFMRIRVYIKVSNGRVKY